MVLKLQAIEVSLKKGDALRREIDDSVVFLPDVGSHPLAIRFP